MSVEQDGIPFVERNNSFQPIVVSNQSVRVPFKDGEKESLLNKRDAQLNNTTILRQNSVKIRNLSLPFLKKTLNKKSLHKTVSQDLDQGITPAKSPITLFHLLHQIVLFVSGLNAGVVNIQKVVGYCNSHSFDQFREFL